MMKPIEEKIRDERVDTGLLALCAFILRQMKSGADQQRICKSLTRFGMNLEDATALVAKVQSGLMMAERVKFHN